MNEFLSNKEVLYSGRHLACSCQGLHFNHTPAGLCIGTDCDCICRQTQSWPQCGQWDSTSGRETSQGSTQPSPHTSGLRALHRLWRRCKVRGFLQGCLSSAGSHRCFLSSLCLVVGWGTCEFSQTTLPVLWVAPAPFCSFCQCYLQSHLDCCHSSLG